ncbi:MAG: GerMN domain-containing protein [Patescibacteria group bacterium]
MQQIIKYFTYIIACSLIFILLVKVFDGGNEAVTVANAFEWQKPVDIYFVDKNTLETDSCEATYAVQRMVPNAETLGPGSMNALIDGLTMEEEEDLFSAISDSTLLQNFEIIDRVAYVDFSSDLSENVAGSCNVVAIRSQIENTLNSLVDIDSVVISVNGETEGILEP